MYRYIQYAGMLKMSQLSSRWQAHLCQRKKQYFEFLRIRKNAEMHFCLKLIC